MSATTQLAYRHIDDYLGPGETRFFSHGYRRATYDVRDVHIEPAAAGPQVTATVSVAYPADWSRKKAGHDLRPHLSTVDMLVLGAQLAELYLAHAYALDAVAQAGAWLRRVTLTAGTSPQEDLADIPAAATLRETVPAPDADGGFVSTFDCRVGAMRGRYEVIHTLNRRVDEGVRYATPDELLGPAAARYSGLGFTTGSQSVQGVTVDMAALTAEATAWLFPAAGVSAGLEGVYQPSVSMLDCFVVNLQLAQILMYELDSISRADSNTLWMLRTVLEAEHPDRPSGEPLAAHIKMTAKHLLPLRGGRWRNAEFIAQLGGVGMRCSFAHELPTASQRHTPGSSQS
jgi:Pseudomonas avirulence D protein (AvrD)